MTDEFEIPEVPTTESGSEIPPPPATGGNPPAVVRKTRGRPSKKKVEPETKSNTVVVTTVHPYKLFCHSQSRWLEPGQRTELIRDSWVEGQLKMKGIKEV